MFKIKLVTLVEQTENTLTDEDCQKFLNWLDTVIINSIWEDKVAFKGSGDDED